MGQLRGAGRVSYLSSNFHHFFFAELWCLLTRNNHKLRCLRLIWHAWEHQRKVFISFSPKSKAFLFDLPATFVLLSIWREPVFMDESIQQIQTLLITVNERHFCFGWKLSDRDGIVNEHGIASHIANSGWIQLTPSWTQSYSQKTFSGMQNCKKETKGSLPPLVHRLSAQPPYCMSALASARGEPAQSEGQRLTACDGTNWCLAASEK